MKKITVKEALEQGYERCGYDLLENQNLIQLDQLEAEDFESYKGHLVLAKKEANSASIDTTEVIEWLVERYFDTDGNPDDDGHDMELCFKEKTGIIEDFVLKMNEVYKEKLWWFLDSDLRLVPDENGNKSKPLLGEVYWTFNISYLPVQVEILELDSDNRMVRINQGWISFDRLYESEDKCPQR
jgi:hypothetical protein